MLVGGEAEELVFDDGAAEGATGNPAMQWRILLIVGNVVVVLEEEWRGVDPVGAAMAVESAMKFVSARSGAERDVRAGGRALLSVVHGRVDLPLLNGFRRWCRDGVADGEIDGSNRLNDAADTKAAGDTGAVDDARGADLTRALAVEEIAGIDAVKREAVGGVALTVGPDGLIAEAGVGT